MTNGLREALFRVGGPNSVTWFAFWVTLIANVLHHLGGAPDLPADRGTRLVAVLVSQVAMFGVLLIARATVLRGSALRSLPWATMAVFAVAGLARGVALLVVWEHHVDLQTAQVVQRLSTGVVSFTVYLAVSAYVVDLYKQNKRTLEQSEQTQASLVAARRHAQQVLAAERQEAVDEVRAEIAAHLDIQQSSALRPQHLDTFLEEALRPMIRQLAEGVQRWSPPPPAAVHRAASLKRVYASIGLGPPFAPGAQSVLSMASTVGISAVLPWWHSLPAVLTTLLGPWVLFSVGNRVLRALTPQTPHVTRVAAVGAWLLVCAGALGAIYGLIMWGTPYTKAGVMSGVFVTFLLGVTTVIVRATLTAQRTSESELIASTAQLRWEIARLGQLHWHQQQQLARALHGPVQTAVIQAAMKPDGEHADVVRQRLFEALHDALQDSTTLSSVSSVLAAATRSWADICDVTGHVDTAAAADRLALRCLAELIQEAVTNAVRHGGASTVAITIAAQADSLGVTVVDNGATSAPRGGTGLGTRMLDDCCLEWSRQRTDDGNRTWFLLPVRGGSATPAPAH